MLPERYAAQIREVTLNLMRKTLARTPIRANDLTVLSLVLTLGAIWVLASGAFVAGGILIACASSFDMLDGALARAKNEASRFGAFLDSTLDRYAEVLIFFGLALFYVRQGNAATEIMLIIASVTGSLLVSYMRARAEGLGLDGKVGLLERPERIVLIVLGLLTGWVTLALWILAIFTHVTALQRFIHVLMQIRAAEQANAPAKPRKKSQPVVKG